MCGGERHEETGTIVSPNHPQHYPNDLECEWHLTIPQGIIAINLTEFDVCL